MNIEETLQKAAAAAKKLVVENLWQSDQKTGTTNPFGDKTLLLDMKCEEEIIKALTDSGENFVVLTEEQGEVFLSENPDYIAIVDP
ncbi:hypothetical protein EU546_04500, partial [Candidatus Thorarchaeota archaeon]